MHNCKEAFIKKSACKLLTKSMAGKDQKLEKTVKFSEMQFAGDRSCIQEK